MIDCLSTCLSQDLSLLTDKRFLALRPSANFHATPKNAWSQFRLETVYSWFQCSFRGFLLIVQAIVCNFILSLEKWDNLFFCYSQKPFFCTETFVDTANGRQNRHYFPILCIFTQALVDLTNNSQVFSLTLSWIFHLLAKLTLPQSGMAFSVFSIFSYFRFSVRGSWLSHADEQSITPISLFNLFDLFWTDPRSLILDPVIRWSLIRFFQETEKVYIFYMHLEIRNVFEN